MTWLLHWVNKPGPFITSTIESANANGAEAANVRFTKYYKDKALRYLIGPPYEDPTYADGVFTYMESDGNSDFDPSFNTD